MWTAILIVSLVAAAVILVLQFVAKPRRRRPDPDNQPAVMQPDHEHPEYPDPPG